MKCEYCGTNTYMTNRFCNKCHIQWLNKKSSFLYDLSAIKLPRNDCS